MARRSGLGDRLKYWLGELLVYGPLKNRMGLTNMRVGYTAGEAIGPEIFRFYRSLGLNLKQLYGQTEASVYITAQPDGEIRADTVGRRRPGVEIRSRERRGDVPLARRVRRILQERRGDHSTKTNDMAGFIRAMPVSSTMKAISRSSTGPRMSAS
jgi:long-chain acyl-CoA synthetase